MSLIYGALREIERLEQSPEAAGTLRAPVAAAPWSLPVPLVLLLLVALLVGLTSIWLQLNLGQAFASVDEPALVITEPAVPALATVVAVAPVAAAAEPIAAPVVPVAVAQPARVAVAEPVVVAEAVAPVAPVAAVAASPVPVSVAPPVAVAPVPAVAELPRAQPAVAVNLNNAPVDPPAEHVTPMAADAPSLGQIGLQRVASNSAAAQEMPVAAAQPAAAPAVNREQQLQAARQGIQVRSRSEAVAQVPVDEQRIAEVVAAFSAAMNRQEPSAAAPHLQQLETLLPAQSLTLLRMRAWWLSASERTDEAARAYEQILARRPNDATASVNLAVLQADQGRYAQARSTIGRLDENGREYARVDMYIRSLEHPR